MLKKILFLIISLFLISTFSFAENVEQQKTEIEMVGPTSLPDIVGPKSGPPTRKEIDKLKYTRDSEFIGKKPIEVEEEEVGFFDWLWNSFISLF